MSARDVMLDIEPVRHPRALCAAFFSRASAVKIVGNHWEVARAAADDRKEATAPCRLNWL